MVEPKEKDEKPKVKRIKLVKHINEPLRSSPIPAVPITSFKGTKLVEPKEIATRSGLPLIDFKAKGNKMMVEDPKFSNIQVAINLSMQQVDRSAKKIYEQIW